jgi:hypothetical protein
MRKSKEITNKGDAPPAMVPPEGSIRAPGRPGPTPGGFRFRTLHEAERVLQRVANLILERERSLLEREAAAEALRAAKKEGCDPNEWPPMPPLRGLSNEGAGKIINVINAFIISRRFQDEVAEKRRVDDLENRLNEALELNERYGKRLEELVASQRGNN